MVAAYAGGGVRGYEGAKKLVGRKRQVLVDTQGLLQAVNVHTADSIPPTAGIAMA